MTLAIAGNSASGYNLTKSLRFRNSAVGYLNRTPASSSNRKTFTWSGWVKVTNYNYHTTVFAAGNNNFVLKMAGAAGSSYALQVYDYNGSTYNFQLISNALYRDPSAWYHLVLAVDTTQATSSNRVRVYVNNSEVTSFSTSTYPSQNLDTYVNSTTAHYAGVFGSSYLSTSYAADMYLAEVNFIDGQALTPSSFGSTNALTGVWQPAKYTGTYGTNGFYLPFTNTTSTTTLGYDFSGNSNNWTVNNISLTAGSTYDSMTDVPTLTSATTANYCVLNPLSTTSSIIDGNLKYSGGTTFATATTFPSSGKFYAEVVTSGSFSAQGIAWGFASGNAGFPSTAQPGAAAINGTWFVYSGGGLLGTWVDTASGSNYSNPFTVGQTWQLAIDATNGYVWLGQNNTWYSSTFTATGNPATGANPTFTISSISTRNGISVLCGLNTTGGTFTWNFGAGSGFTYTPPTGYVALNTYNLPTSTIVQGNKYMDATLYTGNASTNTITNSAGFKPDFVWMKSRGNNYDNILYDSVRGAGTGKDLVSNATQAEGGDSTLANLTSFNSNGFSLGTTSSTNIINNSGGSFVGWQWQAGQGTNTSNTNGSITSTVSVNASAGFSIVTYTGTGANATVGHGLGVAPKMIITKVRSTTNGWVSWHTSIGANQYVVLSNVNGVQTDTTVWNNTLPTSSVFSLGASVNTNISSATYVAYCWAEIAGFSKFGSYTGNGSSDGTFIYTGFRPKYIMIKRTDSTGNWVLQDTSRSPYNQSQANLYANLSNPEDTGTTYLDILSNGFKCRVNENNSNINGGTYIYAAFAENPFRNALAR